MLPFVHRLIGRSTHFRFDATAAGGELEVIEAGFARRAVRVGGVVPAGAHVAAEASGPYANADAGGTLRLAMDGEHLVLHGHGEYGAAHWPAQPLGPDLVRAWGPGSAVGLLLRLERDSSGRVDALHLSSLRTRSLRFTA